MVLGAGVDMSREKCLCGAWSWCGHNERENAYVVPGAGVDMSREKCLCGARSWCGHDMSGHHIGSSIAVRTGCDVEVDETLGLGRPKMV